MPSRPPSAKSNKKLTASDSDSPLELLYAQLVHWMPIPEFEQAMQAYFLGARSKAEIEDYRAKRGVPKKLRDEIAPVLHHLKFAKATGEVRFELNSSVPDCWLRSAPEATPQGLEVTVAQSREQYHLAIEMNKTGFGRGFVGIADDATPQVVAEKMARPRIMYTTASALERIGYGIKSCLRKKHGPKYAGHDLLIEAPLRTLPKERWGQIYNDLRSEAFNMPFREIHVIGNQGTEPFGFRIK
jgi:hypothetical protein